VLRLITVRHGSAHRLELHGTLGGEWVPLLEQHWRAIMRSRPAPTVTVVLSNVEFIDADGERLLQQMADAGVDFAVSGCMNRYLIEKLQAGAAKVGARA
jgi:hypothetical protein